MVGADGGDGHGQWRYSRPSSTPTMAGRCGQGPPGHVVTITVSGAEPEEFFRAGRDIAVWNGHDMGHGVVSRRVFSQRTGVS